jgi:hypothetical protein
VAFRTATKPLQRDLQIYTLVLDEVQGAHDRSKGEVLEGLASRSFGCLYNEGPRPQRIASGAVLRILAEQRQ